MAKPGDFLRGAGACGLAAAALLLLMNPPHRPLRLERSIRNPYAGHVLRHPAGWNAMIDMSGATVLTEPGSPCGRVTEGIASRLILWRRQGSEPDALGTLVDAALGEASLAGPAGLRVQRGVLMGLPAVQVWGQSPLAWVWVMKAPQDDGAQVAVAAAVSKDEMERLLPTWRRIARHARRIPRRGLLDGCSPVEAECREP